MRFDGPFSLMPVDELEAADRTQGLKVHARGTPAAAGERAIEVAVSWELAEPELARFVAARDAIVLHAVGADGAWSLRLVDPERETFEYRPNFTGNPTGWGSPNVGSGGWIRCTVVVPQRVAGPTFLHATLLGRASAVVKVESDAS